jgi:hypothetical protein
MWRREVRAGRKGAGELAAHAKAESVRKSQGRDEAIPHPHTPARPNPWEGERYSISAQRARKPRDEHAPDYHQTQRQHAFRRFHNNGESQKQGIR